MRVRLCVIEDAPTPEGLARVLELLDGQEQVAWVACGRVVLVDPGDTAAQVHARMLAAQRQGAPGGHPMLWSPDGSEPSVGSQAWWERQLKRCPRTSMDVRGQSAGRLRTDPGQDGESWRDPRTDQAANDPLLARSVDSWS